DMELAFAEVSSLSPKGGRGVNMRGHSFIDSALRYARLEPVTPWFGDDTAKHYQWYPFINVGHYELAKQLKGNKKDSVIGFYKEGIERVWNIAKNNAFYRGVPFIWCSNNLTTSFAIQCYWYRQLSNDKTFDELEQANFDWLFGCNPWGTSMVYGLPSWGDTPTDPHSSFTHLANYPIDGGLIDGPVYTSIYKNLIGITLYKPDEHEAFQSDLAVYHDDYGDYSTNEPTMDGTASLIYLLAAKEAVSPVSNVHAKNATRSELSNETFSYTQGAIVRGDSTKKQLAIVFSGDEFAEGGNEVLNTLKDHNIKASFFFTGNFYRNPAFTTLIREIKKDGHYLGPHSNKHLLYCDWNKRDSLLVTKKQFEEDLRENYKEMKTFDLQKKTSHFFLPPYEWHNDSIAAWTKDMGLQLINFTPGTLSNADYTTSKDHNYRSSDLIYNSIIKFQENSSAGLNGFILLMHAGAGPGRKDKFYKRLPGLLTFLEKQHYKIVPINELLN
ncbi:MAG: glycoside hydrolase family 9 protein, partial [Ginsengibacter sp.]